MSLHSSHTHTHTHSAKPLISSIHIAGMYKHPAGSSTAIDAAVLHYGVISYSQCSMFYTTSDQLHLLISFRAQWHKAAKKKN